MMLPMPATVVRGAIPEDFDAIIDLVAGMFQDLGTSVLPDAWRNDLQPALASRLWDDVAAFVAVDPADVPIAVAVGIIDQRLPSPRRAQGKIGYVEWLATTAMSRRQGAARAATTALLEWFDEHEIDVVDVHSSPSAQPIYSSLGFDDPTSRRALRRPAALSSNGLVRACAVATPMATRQQRGRLGFCPKRPLTCCFPSG
jgi:hypothetical protein